MGFLTVLTQKFPLLAIFSAPTIPFCTVVNLYYNLCFYGNRTKVAEYVV
jgi:hypothetical protein